MKMKPFFEERQTTVLISFNTFIKVIDKNCQRRYDRPGIINHKPSMAAEN
jgi:hypothetical protein